ncbi:aspartate aminotransferase family protein (plasmid) [Variovorax paradoxus]|nr:aspartate aminotransferase family protein [Variovorax paradoxus]
MHTAAYERAAVLLPGGTTNSLTQPPGLEFVIDRAEGVHVIDLDGNKRLDFMLGAGPLVLGHAHPRIVAAISKQAARGTHYFGLADRAVDLAARISKYVPSAEMVRFAGSGTEATMHAIRLARAVTGRSGYIKFDGAWHGHSDLASWSMESSPTQPTPYAESAGIQHGVGDDLVVLPYNDAAAVKQLLEKHPTRFAALICEPAQRALAPEPGFLETLREECTKAGVVLIFDEVVTGFRLAPGGAQELYGVVPDLTTLGKALSGGLPLAALVGKRWVMEHLTPGSDPATFSFHCGTFNGSPMAVETAHTTMDILVEEGGIQQLEEIGNFARESVSSVFRDLGLKAQITGIGPMFHYYFTEEKVTNQAIARRANNKLGGEIFRRMYSAGIYRQAAKNYLSVVHTHDHIAQYCDILKWAASGALRGEA